MGTSPATEHALLADQRVDARDIEKLKETQGRFNSTALHIKYPYILKATFDTARTNMRA